MARAIYALAFASALTLCLSQVALAQHKVSRTYPARKNIRLQLANWSGSVTVEGWNRSEIRVSARMESLARFAPEMTDDALIIDIVRDNRGRADIPDINFVVQVPINSTVDIETRKGDITVRDVQGPSVHAHVSLEGDIQLTGIRSSSVMAENIIGNIFFDGELSAGGEYMFKTVQGDISIRIPESSGFRLNATAPFTKSISLGMFENRGLNSVGEGRKVVGTVGDGRTAVTVVNQRGSISFLRR